MNNILNRAKYTSNTDEWYTSYQTIKNELIHYIDEFKDKVILCNCDDPFESAFARYFIENFNKLKLKKLICISYDNSYMVLDNNKIITENGYAMVLKELPDDVSQLNLEHIIYNYAEIISLKDNGDFRSDESINYLKQADILVTNPPFSLFKELFSILTKYEKKFLLICNQNAILYKEVFPYIKNNLVWSGHNFGDMAFKVPADTPPSKTRFWIDENNQKWKSLGNAMWLTNLKVDRKEVDLILKHNFNSDMHKNYDNYNAIHINKISEIPKDYFGIMGVPLTYIKYHNKNKFEIVGEANHGTDNEYDLFKPIVEGKEMYKRILIKRKEKKFSILDLFCGAGGMSFGMDKNKYFNTVIGVDINYKLAQTFAYNFPNSKLIIGDILDSKVKEEIVESAIQNNVNMIIGGPPCQGFSLKGKKLGLEDPRNFLFLEFLDLVNKINPDIFVIENVKNLMNTANGWFRSQIESKVNEMGYFSSVGILNAKDFGIPQNRERVFFICSKKKKINLPLGNSKRITTVRDAISDLSYLNSGEGTFEQDYLLPSQSDYQKLMRSNSNKLYNHIASNHSDIAVKKLSMIPPEKGREFLPKELLGKQKFKSTWGRLIWDKPSSTIDTRFDAASNGRNNHPYLNRSITPREAARIQSFDDNFIFKGKKVDIRTQIGNAVPPLLSKAIADKIVEDYFYE